MTDFQEKHAAVKVLLVDDAQDALALYRHWLQGDGYQVVTARDGFEALQVAARWRPDIAILDFQMPGMTGAELASLLLSRAETRRP
jgi:CheY-like chemotaxis protein